MADKIRCATAPYPAESGFAELVRDNERLFLERMLPLVERRCVALDFHTVKRIDAAGLATLISLYCAAREAGHTFTVSNPSPHVGEILALVGLNAILESQNTENSSYCSTRFEETAA
jgi:anti-anti-sigma factor